MANDINMQQLVNKGIAAVKSAKTRITELETELSGLRSSKKARNSQIAKAAALGPQIVDQLIKAGMISKSQRETAIKNMSDPVKVAEELSNVLSMRSGVPAMGSVDKTDKSAKITENPMQIVDDNFRRQIGL